MVDLLNKEVQLQMPMVIAGRMRSISIIPSVQLATSGEDNKEDTEARQESDSNDSNSGDEFSLIARDNQGARDAAALGYEISHIVEIPRGYTEMVRSKTIEGRQSVTPQGDLSDLEDEPSPRLSASKNGKDADGHVVVEVSATMSFIEIPQRNSFSLDRRKSKTKHSRGIATVRVPRGPQNYVDPGILEAEGTMRAWERLKKEMEARTGQKSTSKFRSVVGVVEVLQGLREVGLDPALIVRGLNLIELHDPDTGQMIGPHTAPNVGRRHSVMATVTTFIARSASRRDSGGNDMSEGASFSLEQFTNEIEQQEKYEHLEEVTEETEPTSESEEQRNPKEHVVQLDQVTEEEDEVDDLNSFDSSTKPQKPLFERKGTDAETSADTHGSVYKTSAETESAALRPQDVVLSIDATREPNFEHQRRYSDVERHPYQQSQAAGPNPKQFEAGASETALPPLYLTRIMSLRGEA
eukprot:jgi/Hompol1/5839/HPOL_004746-RA